MKQPLHALLIACALLPLHAADAVSCPKTAHRESLSYSPSPLLDPEPSGNTVIPIRPSPHRPSKSQTS